MKIKARNDNLKIISIIIMAFGAVCLSVSLFIFIYNKVSLSKYNHNVVASKIDDNCTYDNLFNTIVCHPVYYYSVNNKTYTCDSSNSSNNPSKEKNKVYYNDKDASKCITEFDRSFYKLSIWELPIEIGIIIVGVIVLIIYFKKDRKIKRLLLNGILVKDLSYQIEESNIRLAKRGKDEYLSRIGINYTFPDNRVRHLTSKLILDGKKKDDDGFVDLLYDPGDYNNYYIDFDIEIENNK